MHVLVRSQTPVSLPVAHPRARTSAAHARSPARPLTLSPSCPLARSSAHQPTHRSMFFCKSALHIFAIVRTLVSRCVSVCVCVHYIFVTFCVNVCCQVAEILRKKSAIQNRESNISSRTTQAPFFTSLVLTFIFKVKRLAFYLFCEHLVYSKTEQTLLYRRIDSRVFVIEWRYCYCECCDLGLHFQAHEI